MPTYHNDPSNLYQIGLYSIILILAWITALTINPEKNYKFPEHQDAVVVKMSSLNINNNKNSPRRRIDTMKLHYNDFGAETTTAPSPIEQEPKNLRFPNEKIGKIAANLLDLYRKSFQKEFIDRGEVIPCVITPTMHDGDLLRKQLKNYDAPVRHFVFIVNAKDDTVEQILSEIAPLENIGAVSILRHDNFNSGFAGAINMGMRRSKHVLTGESEYKFLEKWNLSPLWYFAVNCDAVFPNGNLAKFAIAVNKELNAQSSGKNTKDEQQGQPPGLFFGHIIDFFATGITDAAVQKAGELDEVFYPAYMEDIDWKWRIQLAGFRSVKTGVIINHLEHINIRRISAVKKSSFMEMMKRTEFGFEYGRMKWGFYNDTWTRAAVPPNGRTTPFGIENFPLSLWKVDPVHRKCVITGEGIYRRNTKACWYNISVLKDLLPRGVEIPKKMLSP